QASGLFAGGFLVGGITGPAIGGHVVTWSPRAPFFIYGVMLIVPAVIAAAVLRDAPARPAAGRRPAAGPFAATLQALRTREYRAGRLRPRLWTARRRARRHDRRQPGRPGRHRGRVVPDGRRYRGRDRSRGGRLPRRYRLLRGSLHDGRRRPRSGGGPQHFRARN